jgi:hypothetical protein
VAYLADFKKKGLFLIFQQNNTLKWSRADTGGCRKILQILSVSLAGAHCMLQTSFLLVKIF